MIGHFAYGVRKFGERSTHTIGEALAFVGQTDAAARSLDQAHAQVRFERLDLVADRAVREMQCLRRPGETASARGRFERPQRLHGR